MAWPLSWTWSLLLFGHTFVCMFFSSSLLLTLHSLILALCLSIFLTLLICCCCRRCSSFVTFSFTHLIGVNSFLFALRSARLGPWICDLNAKICDSVLLFISLVSFPSFFLPFCVVVVFLLYSTLTSSDYGLLFRLQSIMKSENKSQHSWNFLFKFV